MNGNCLTQAGINARTIAIQRTQKMLNANGIQDWERAYLHRRIGVWNFEIGNHGEAIDQLNLAMVYNPSDPLIIQNLTQVVQHVTM